MCLESKIGVVIWAMVAVAQIHLNNLKHTLKRLTPQG